MLLHNVNLRPHPARLNRSAQEASNHRERIVLQEAIGATSLLTDLNYRSSLLHMHEIAAFIYSRVMAHC